MKLIYSPIKSFFFISFLAIISFKSAQSTDNWDFSIFKEESPFFQQILENDKLINHQNTRCKHLKRKTFYPEKTNNHKNKKNKEQNEIFEIPNNNIFFHITNLEPKGVFRENLTTNDNFIELDINDNSSNFISQSNNDVLLSSSDNQSGDLVNDNTQNPISIKKTFQKNTVKQNKKKPAKNKKKTYVKWNKGGLYNTLKECMNKLNITKETWQDHLATTIHERLEEEKNKENVSWHLPSEVAIRDKVRRELGLK